MWRCCFVGVYLFVLRKKIKPSNATFLSLCGEKRKKARIHFRKGAIVVDTYDRYTEENDFSRALIKTPICFPKKKRCIGNPAGIGKGTGFGLWERDWDGIGLGHYRLRANLKTYTVNTGLDS